MDTRGREGRLGETVATEGVRSAAAPVGSGTLFCLDWPQPKDEQGLREAMCKQRSVRICCHELPHAEAIGSHLRLFHTVSLGTSVNKTSLLLAQWSERLSDLRRKQFGLLPRGEVAALVDLVEVGEVGVGVLDPAARGPPDLARERG